MSIKARLKSYAPLVDDLLRYNMWSQGALSLVHWLLAVLTPAHRVAWLVRACAAARCAPSNLWMEAIEAWMLRRLDALPREILWSWQPEEKAAVEVNKAAILKLPSGGEKGVVFVSFESQWEKLLALGPKRLEAFAAEFGQDKPVFVHRLVVRDTVEERMLELKEKKRALAEAAVGDGGAAVGLTRDDLLALLT